MQSNRSRQNETVGAELWVSATYKFCGFTLAYPLVLTCKLDEQLEGVRCASEAHVAQLYLKRNVCVLPGHSAM